MNKRLIASLAASLCLGCLRAYAALVVGIADMCSETNRVSVKTTYVDAVAAAGNMPLVLPAQTNRAAVAQTLASVDMLLLCGGEDVEPCRYGTEPSPLLGEVNRRRDAWEFLLLDEAVKRRLPVFGICRGCQLINVYFGGTLWQDLPSERPGEVAHRDEDGHAIRIVAGSRLADCLGTDGLKVNSSHHQAVKDLAPGFKATAFAPDGVVEAIESETLPIAGVQFHPEKSYVMEGRGEFREIFANPLRLTGSGKVDAAALTVPLAYTNEAGEVLLYRRAESFGRAGVRPSPLVLFLHGAGERGSDNAAQLKHGVGPILDFFAERNEPVCLLAPQCPEGRKWVEVDWAAASHAMPPEASVSMRLALALVEKTIRTRNIDPSRVYVTGLSMGGFGTWDAISRRPDLFAAAMPICGGGDPRQAWRFREMPVFAVHGDADTVVPPARTREMVAALWKVGGRVSFIEYPGCGHGSWGPAYSDKELLGRFFGHTKKDALPCLSWLSRRTDEPDVWEADAGMLTPEAFLERVRQVGVALRRASAAAQVAVRRDKVKPEFAAALDAFGEGEEYVWRDGPAANPLKGMMDGPLLYAGSGRAVLVGEDGAVLRRWDGCGNIHCVRKTADHLYWSNGRLWRVPLAGGAPELVWRAVDEAGGGVLGFEMEPDGAIVMAVNSTCEIVELAPQAAFPSTAPRRERVRFKVDARDSAGKLPGRHARLRLVRKMSEGTYLVCCAGAACVREFDRKGRLVWEQPAPPFAFDCARRANGNTLVSHLDGVTEFTPDHRVAWSFRCADAPELKLANVCGIQERRNGNLVLGTWSNGSPAREKATICEITRDKKIVWSYAADDANSMTAFRVD